MGSVVMVVRAARKADLPARLELTRATLAETYLEAFLYFFFQELTLQGVVLCGAVLFIFAGVSVGGCALLLPAAAALVLAAVHMHAAAILAAEPMKLNREVLGFVAELHWPLLVPAGIKPRVVFLQEYNEDEINEPLHKEVVGSVSVCRAAAAAGAGGDDEWWVRGLRVAARWRRAGAGGALLGAARRAAARGGRARLLAAVSALQPAARALLHKHGWECRGTYHRQLLGDALVLPMAQLALPLPHA